MDLFGEGLANKHRIAGGPMAFFPNPVSFPNCLLFWLVPYPTPSAQWIRGLHKIYPTFFVFFFGHSRYPYGHSEECMKRFLAVLSFLCVADFSWGQTPDWPLKIEIKQSSSFAEFRGLRFHAGIDLKTRGVTGFPVYAIADGFISRIKVQHRGGGNNLYVDHKALGARAVFMHLERYAEPMAAYVAEKQKKMNARYGLDDSFGEDRFPVKKGQIIAYTGETGAGPAHLHFEMRRFNDDPISPSLLGFVAPESSIPEALNLHVDPLAADARIEDGFRPLTIPLKAVSKGKYKWVQPIAISGRVGLHVGLIDHGEGGSKFGVETVRLEVDGKLSFERKFHRFTYGQNSQCPYVYDLPKTGRPGTGFVYTLFRWPFETTPFSEGFPPWAGALELGNGRHNVAIIAKDFAGNQVEINGEVAGEPIPPLGEPFRAPLVSRQTEYLPFSVVVECAKKGGIQPNTHSVSVRDAEGREQLLPACLKKGVFSISFPIDKRWEGGAWSGDSQILAEHKYIGSSGGTVDGPSGAKAVFPPHALNLPVLSRFELERGPQPLPKSGKPVIEELSPVWKFFPEDLVTDQPADFVFPVKPGTSSKQIGVFQFVQGRSYDFQGGEIHGEEISYSSRVPTRFVVARDTLPPKCSFNGIREVSNLGSCYVYIVDDEGKGIDYYATQATIDRQRVETDSDPDKSAVYILRGARKVGKCKVNVKIFDRAGNFWEANELR